MLKKNFHNILPKPRFVMPVKAGEENNTHRQTSPTKANKPIKA